MSLYVTWRPIWHVSDGELHHGHVLTICGRSIKTDWVESIGDTDTKSSIEDFVSRGESRDQLCRDCQLRLLGAS